MTAVSLQIAYHLVSACLISVISCSYETNNRVWPRAYSFIIISFFSLHVIKDHSNKIRVFDGCQLHFRPFDGLQSTSLRPQICIVVLRTVCQSFFQPTSARIYKVDRRLDFLGIEHLKRTKATPQCQGHFGIVEGVVTSLCQTFWMPVLTCYQGRYVFYWGGLTWVFYNFFAKKVVPPPPPTSWNGLLHDPSEIPPIPPQKEGNGLVVNARIS